jgi:hypothetical protein
VKQEPAAAIKAEPGGVIKADPDGKQQQQQHKAGLAAVKQEQRTSGENSDMTLGIAADQEANVGIQYEQTCRLCVVVCGGHSGLHGCLSAGLELRLAAVHGAAVDAVPALHRALQSPEGNTQCSCAQCDALEWSPITAAILFCVCTRDIAGCATTAGAQRRNGC